MTINPLSQHDSLISACTDSEAQDLGFEAGRCSRNKNVYLKEAGCELVLLTDKYTDVNLLYYAC